MWPLMASDGSVGRQRHERSSQGQKGKPHAGHGHTGPEQNQLDAAGVGLGRHI